MSGLIDSATPGPAHAERAFRQLRLAHRALQYGPSVAQVVETLLTASLREAEREAQDLMRLARRYGCQRLEAACRRAIYYRQKPDSGTVCWILEKRFDHLPLHPFTDIGGQFTFQFDGPQIKGRNNVESRLMCENESE